MESSGSLGYIHNNGKSLLRPETKSTHQTFSSDISGLVCLSLSLSGLYLSVLLYYTAYFTNYNIVSFEGSNLVKLCIFDYLK